jgi:hypothetical protein
MAELFETAASWPTLLLVLLVFGFAPGFVLRLLVFAYPRSDPRRRELIAELYAVHRIQRPLWVAEQLEAALFEGVPQRIRAVRRRLQARRRKITDEERVRMLKELYQARKRMALARVQLDAYGGKPRRRWRRRSKPSA